MKGPLRPCGPCRCRATARSADRSILQQLRIPAVAQLVGRQRHQQHWQPVYHGLTVDVVNHTTLCGRRQLRPLLGELVESVMGDVDPQPGQPNTTP